MLFEMLVSFIFLLENAQIDYKEQIILISYHKGFSAIILT